MKITRKLLIFFAIFLIIPGPLLMITGHLYGKVFISGKEYIIAVLLFIIAVVIYAGNNKRVV